MLIHAIHNFDELAAELLGDVAEMRLAVVIESIAVVIVNASYAV